MVSKSLKKVFYSPLPDTLVVESSFKLTANGLRIGDGGAFEKRLPNICTNAR
jgi:hypothetical protein